MVVFNVRNFASRRLHLLLALTLMTGLLWSVHVASRSSFSPLNGPSQSVVVGKIEFDYFHRAGLVNIAPSIDYARCRFMITRAEGNLDSPLTEQLQGALPSFTSLNLTHKNTALPMTDVSHFNIEIPKASDRPDQKHIIYGLATSMDRLRDSLDAISHWASGANARLFAIVEPCLDAEISQVQTRATALGFSLTITQSASDVNERYFSLIPLLHSQTTADTHYAVLIDDDTFFPSPAALLSRLSAYSHLQPQYIGGLSEDFVQMNVWSFMAYGGAGIFLSVPLLATLNTHYDGCNAAKLTGDMRLAFCIYTHTPTKLTWLPDLHQIDLHNDSSGFYEAARAQPLSVHHWKSWAHFDMAQLAVVAAVCDDAALLRHFSFKDGWRLTNGFSLVRYSADLAPDDISMEKTWTDFASASDQSYLHTLAPLRPRDPAKVQFLMERAVKGEELQPAAGEDAGKEGRNIVTQFYVHRNSNGVGDRVVEIVWERET